MKLTLLALGMLCTIICSAQDPVRWNFSAKKIDDTTIDIYMSAVAQSPWTIYSQLTPEGGPLPTRFSFTKNPLYTTEGTVKEIGELHKKHEALFGVDVLYYTGKADFVQRIKLKTKAKTSFSGSLEFMSCNEKSCLPPKTIPFTVKL